MPRPVTRMSFRRNKRRSFLKMPVPAPRYSKQQHSNIHVMEEEVYLGKPKTQLLEILIIQTAGYFKVLFQALSMHFLPHLLIQILDIIVSHFLQSIATLL